MVKSINSVTIVFLANNTAISSDVYITLITPIHRKKKDGGCEFFHNTLRTKPSPLGIWRDKV